MGDDLNQKFAQISELLNQEGMAENIKGIISMLSSSADTKDSKEAQDTPQKKEEETIREKPQAVKGDKLINDKNTSELEQNLDMMRQVQRVMEVMRSSKDDPRVNLLNAIRPYLNNTRQKKVNNALRFLQMSNVTKLMDKDGKSLFK